MKYNQSHPGFELVSPCPYPAMITITPRAPPRFSLKMLNNLLTHWHAVLRLIINLYHFGVDFLRVQKASVVIFHIVFFMSSWLLEQSTEDRHIPPTLPTWHWPLYRFLLLKYISSLVPLTTSCAIKIMCAWHIIPVHLKHFQRWWRNFFQPGQKKSGLFLNQFSLFFPQRS